MGETAIYMAVEMGRLKQVQTLLKYGADANIPTNDGVIPLHSAVLRQDINIVEILLQYSSNPNFKNKYYGQTPVHYAIRSKVKPAIIFLLVQCGGSLSIRDKFNKRPLDYVETEEMREVMNKLRQEREDAFKTPQKEPLLSTPNRLSKENFTILNRILSKTLSENNLTYINENKEFTEEDKPTKEDDNSSKFTCNLNDRIFIDLDNKFDSFITKYPKFNSPDFKEDGISQMNPLDTLNSGNGVYTLPHTDEKYSNVSIKKEDIIDEDSNEDLTTPVKINKSLPEEQDSLEKKNGRMRLDIDKAIILMESFGIKDPFNKEDTIREHNFYSYLTSTGRDRTEVDLTYSKSYVISDLPLTSVKKEPVKEFISENAIDNSTENKMKTKKLNNPKMFYRGGKGEHKENISCNFQREPESVGKGYQNDFISHTAGNSYYPCEFNAKNVGQFDEKSNSPSVKRRLFSDQGNFQGYKNQISPRYLNSTSGEECNCNKDSGSFNNVKNTYYVAQNSKGNMSTRNTSTHNVTEDCHCSVYPRKREHSAINAHPNMNMSHTIVQYQDLPPHHKKVKQISCLTNFSRKNSPSARKSDGYLQTIYGNDESYHSAISKSNAKKLHEWLSSINLQCYYNNFLEKGWVNVTSLIDGMNEIRTRLTYSKLEEAEIKKPGHIFRILTKLEADSKQIDELYYSGIINNPNKNSMSSCNLRISDEKMVCCGLGSVGTNSNSRKRSDKFKLYYDLLPWLKSINLSHLRKNFVYNGFDLLEYFILQMFSSNPINDHILEECLHIYSKRDRKIILNQLEKDVKTIKNMLFHPVSSKIFSSSKLDDSSYFDNESVEPGCKIGCTIF